MELTEPFEAAVVAVAHSAELATPNRISLPSMFPPGLILLCVWSTPILVNAGLPPCSDQTVTDSSATKMIVIETRIAQPWRVSPTILPNV